jgi:hypothetical protein
MDVRTHIKKLIDVEVDTDDLEALRACPEKHVCSGQDLDKLKDLFLLIEYMEREEVESDDSF